MSGLLIRNLLLQPMFQTRLSKLLSQRCLKSSSLIKIYDHHVLLSQQYHPSAILDFKISHYKEFLRIPVGTSVQFTNISRYYSQQEEKNSTVKINLIVDSSKERNSSDSSDPKKGNKFKRYAIISICILYGGMFLSIMYNLGSPLIDEDGCELRDEFSDLPPLSQFFTRLGDRLYVFKEFLRRPSRERLLPPVNPNGHPKYTLVLELTHVLLYPDWTYQTGWRFKKRPNVDHFLEQLSSPLYEIVVFTSQAGANMYSIVDSLNKGVGGNVINYSLYRDATEFINGEHVKNLGHLNRDLSKVIIVDWNPNAVHLHPENALILPKWNGNDEDSTLVELVSFLKNVAEKDPEDVRDVLSHYKQLPDPMGQFRESQRTLPPDVSA